MFLRSRLLPAFATAAVLASSVLARAQMDPDRAVDGAEFWTAGVLRVAVSAMQRIALFVATNLVLALCCLSSCESWASMRCSRSEGSARA